VDLILWTDYENEQSNKPAESRAANSYIIKSIET